LTASESFTVKKEIGGRLGTMGQGKLCFFKDNRALNKQSKGKASMVFAPNKKIIFLSGLCSVLHSGHATVDIMHGHIGGASNQINRDIGDVPGNRYHGDMSFLYHSDRPGYVESKFSFAAMVNDQSLAMWSLQEAYVGSKGIFKGWDRVGNSGDQMKFGRQVLPWSTVDALWGFGKVNNRRNFDFFEPGQEGLIGISYENKSTSGFFWKAFGSGIYVPELNPSLDINKRNKTITSRNPWANAPAPSASIDENNPDQKPIHYTVDYPEVSDVIYRYSVGANIGWETKHWVVDGFIIRKPENQISPRARVELATSGEHINAFITPEFYYHDVYGGNLKYRNHDIEMYVSGIAVSPNTFPDGSVEATDWTEIRTEKRREDYVGGGISKVNDVYGFGMNYVARLSPYDRDRDSLAQDPRWNQALNFFAMRHFGQSIQLSGDLKYDMLTTDRLLMLRAGYKVSKELLMTLAVNMIGTPENGKSFWSPYTNNDAIFGGLRYVF
jgi:hypothetical protein